MKRSLSLIVLLLSGLALNAVAQAPAASSSSAPARIAVIAFQVAVSQTNEFQRNLADLQKKYDPRRQQIQALGTEIQNLQKQLQVQGDTLSDVERANRAKVIDDKQREAQRVADEAQQDYQSDMQEMFNGVAGKVGSLMTSYVQEYGYTLVLDAGQQQTQLVLYASPSTDITKIVLDAYNLKSGIPAPPPPPAATTPRPAAPRPAAPRPAAKPPATH